LARADDLGLAYWEEIKKNRRLAPTMGLAGLLGGTAGAVVLLNTPQKTFMHLVPWLLLVAASIFAASGPMSRWLARRRLATAGADSEAGRACNPKPERVMDCGWRRCSWR